MTYVLAWKRGQNIYLVADSAITISGNTGKIKSENSSFGEHYQSDSKVVKQGTLKLFSIQNNLLLGYSGNVDLAYEFIDVFKRVYENTNNVRQALILARDGIRPDEREIRIVIGFIDDIIPTIVSYNYDRDGRIKYHDEIVRLGFGETFPVNEYIKEFNSIVDNSNMDEYAHLAIIIATVQHTCLIDNTFKLGVGGFICGAIINQHGIFWQKDMAYILYESVVDKIESQEGKVEFKENFHQMILTGSIEEFFMVKSPITGTGAYCHFPYSDRKFDKEFINKLKSFSYHSCIYFVFLDKFLRRIVFVRKTLDDSTTNSFLNIVKLDDGRVGVEIDQELHKKLIGIPDAMTDEQAELYLKGEVDILFLMHHVAMVKM